MNAPLTDLALAQVLAGFAAEEEGIFLETGRVTDEEYRSFLFRQPVDRLICQAGDDPDQFFARANQYLRAGFYLAGWLGYEFGELLEPILAAQAAGAACCKGTRGMAEEPPLAWLGVYRNPIVYDHRNGSFQGASGWPQVDPASDAEHCTVSGLRPSLDQTEYLAALARIKEYIASGDTYQVNYTLKLLFDFSGSPTALYTRLRRSQSVSFAACLKTGSRWLLSFSPELFFRKNTTECLVRPMKGTIGRGRYLSEDRQLADFLRQDPKSRSENVMIVDLLRNDLGRICLPGAVAVRSLFDVEVYETLQQMTSTITCRLPSDLAIEPLFRALFPCGSVTGAPKIRTMEIIRELEWEPRGVYTGAIGFLSPSGEAVFNVPIRTLQLDGSKGEMGIGSGVVSDSDPEQEWRECLLKGRFLSEPAPDFHLIETLLWQPGAGYWNRDLHLARLADSAAYFLFAYEAGKVTEALAALAEGFSQGPMRVRLTLEKNGVFVLSATSCLAPTAWDLPVNGLQGAPLPMVCIARESTDPASPLLYHKTSQRQLYETERQKALADGFYEVLFVNRRGELTEGSISNLFVKKDGAICTPPVDCGLLNGVFRRHFLRYASLPVREEILRPDDLAGVEAIFIGNSVRGLVEVRLG